MERHAGVLFEGGNWEMLITFRLQELERREKGLSHEEPQVFSYLQKYRGSLL